MSNTIIMPLDTAQEKVAQVKKLSGFLKIVPLVVIVLGFVIINQVDYVYNSAKGQSFFSFITTIQSNIEGKSLEDERLGKKVAEYFKAEGIPFFAFANTKQGLSVNDKIYFDNKTVELNEEAMKWMLAEGIAKNLESVKIGRKIIYGITWIKDIFLLAIIALLVFGQIFAFQTFRSIHNGSLKVTDFLEALKSVSASASLQRFKEILQTQQPGHLKDIVMRWIGLGMQGETQLLPSMMENAAVRRSELVDKHLSNHIGINRTMLKIGFIGTLIGLLITFPPMKDAILSLNKAAGDMGFTSEIAKAIDGDAYAILITLLATAYSVFIELFIIQALKTVYNKFEMVNNYVDEWCLTEYIPLVNKIKIGNQTMDRELALQRKFQEELFAIKKQFLDEMLQFQRAQSTAMQNFQSETVQSFSVSQNEIHKKFIDYLKSQFSTMQSFQKETVQSFSAIQNELNSKIVGFQKESAEKITANQTMISQMQDSVSQNVYALGNSVNMIGQSMQHMIPLQKAFGDRLNELIAYERQYRSFLQAQSGITVPPHLKPISG